MSQSYTYRTFFDAPGYFAARWLAKCVGSGKLPNGRKATGRIRTDDRLHPTPDAHTEETPPSQGATPAGPLSDPTEVAENRNAIVPEPYRGEA